MDHVILFRNTQKGRGGIGFVSDESGENIAVFKSYEEAVDGANNTTMTKVFPYQIVPLDEL